MNVVAKITCGPGLTCDSWVGGLTIVMAFVIFVGSIYLVLSAVFGPRMAYLVLAVSFFGWMLLFSAIWVFGTGAPDSNNLGPRGTEPHWQALALGVEVASPRYPVVERYPNDPWKDPTKGQESSVQSAATSFQEFAAEQANEQLEEQGQPGDLDPLDFTVEDVKFATGGKDSLAAGRVFYNFGGPKVIVFAKHNSGAVQIYSWSFFIVSLLGFLIHLPFLDRAERRRKAVLTGGARPPWYGPA